MTMPKPALTITCVSNLGNDTIFKQGTIETCLSGNVRDLSYPKWDASHRMCLSKKRDRLSGRFAEVKPALAGVPGELMGIR